MEKNGTIDTESIINNNAYYINSGKSMFHVINFMADKIESHSVLDPGQAIASITSILNTQHYGLSKLTFHNVTTLSIEFVKSDCSVFQDYVILTKKDNCHNHSWGCLWSEKSKWIRC
jgi:Iron/zinc purple acid phosphatase-like protein C